MRLTAILFLLGLAIGFCIMGMATFIIPFHLTGVNQALVENNLAYYKDGAVVLNKPVPLVCTRDTFVNNEYTIRDFKISNWSLTDEMFIQDHNTNKLFLFNTCKIAKN